MKALALTDRALLPDDVLGAIFALVRVDHRRTELRAHNYALQEIVFSLVNAGDYPFLSGKFVFSDAGPEPYSPRLNEAMSRLQLAGLIGRENPAYETVTLSETATAYFEQGVKARLQPEQLAELKRAAAAIAHRL